jgi:hypothetical protein
VAGGPECLEKHQNRFGHDIADCRRLDREPGLR